MARVIDVQPYVSAASRNRIVAAMAYPQFSGATLRMRAGGHAWQRMLIGGDPNPRCVLEIWFAMRDRSGRAGVRTITSRYDLSAPTPGDEVVALVPTSRSTWSAAPEPRSQVRVT